MIPDDVEYFEKMLLKWAEKLNCLRGVMQKKLIIFIICVIAIVITGAAFLARSQSNLRRYTLNADQVSSLEKIDLQINALLSQRQGKIEAYAESAGIKPEDFSRFRIEKKDGKISFVEMTPEEIERNIEKQQNGQ